MVHGVVNAVAATDCVKFSSKNCNSISEFRREIGIILSDNVKSELHIGRHMVIFPLFGGICAPRLKQVKPVCNVPKIAPFPVAVPFEIIGSDTLFLKFPNTQGLNSDQIGNQLSHSKARCIEKFVQ